MTWSSTRCEHQFFIASPKTVSVSYEQSEIEVQRSHALLFREKDHELLSQIEPRQQIVYNAFHCYRPILRTERFSINPGFGNQNPDEY